MIFPGIPWPYVQRHGFAEHRLGAIVIKPRSSTTYNPDSQFYCNPSFVVLCSSTMVCLSQVGGPALLSIYGPIDCPSNPKVISSVTRASSMDCSPIARHDFHNDRPDLLEV
jgi:hypothetical protein